MTLVANPLTKCTHFSGKSLLIGVCGSVACYKTPQIMRALLPLLQQISVTPTTAATRFVQPLLFKSLGAKKVYAEMFEDDDIFAHLAPEADAMLICPATATSIAKFAMGLADNMLSAQVLAFSGPILLAPAMNPRMWANAATGANIELLRKRGFHVIPPEEGETACGESGQGRLAGLSAIFFDVLKSLAPDDMKGLKVMVTLGPTREPWDGMRFLSNPSSGKMGAALATCAFLRGASAHVICRPDLGLDLPRQIKITHVATAKEMFEAAQDIWPGMDMGFFTAAVADFAPIPPKGKENAKIKKTDAPGQIELARTPDILTELAGLKKPSQKILGFAAEIVDNLDGLKPAALKKLKAKHMDLIAANRINRTDGVFGSDLTEMLIIDKDGKSETWKPQSKADAAWDLCTWLLEI